jgi:hypothetical protein
MLGWICEKMAIQESTLGGGNFFASGSTIVGNGVSTYSDLCALGEDCLTTTRNGSWDNTHTSNSSNRGERPGRKPSALVQHAQHTGGS